MKTFNAHKSEFDKILFISVIFICMIGIASLYSATFSKVGAGHLNSYVLKQLLWVSFGLVILLIVATFDYNYFLNYSYLLYLLNLFALLLVLAVGTTRYGAKRWIDMGPFNLQPSEFVKLTSILALASFIGNRKSEMNNFFTLILSFLLILPSILLVLIQPDLGTSIIIIPIWLAMVFVGGANKKHLLVLILLGALLSPLAWNFLQDYQKQRLMVFINPNVDPLGAGYTLIQSKIAIGSGGLLGKGWLSGTQNTLNFLPERHTDFIFSVVGEEWGFVGSLILIGLFVIVIWRGMRISQFNSGIENKSLAVGLTTLIFVHVFVNIGMTMGLMPVVGLPLPFISYGGSNLLTFMVAIGLLLNLGLRRH